MEHMTEVTMIEKVARAIRAKVPEGYGMTGAEAVEYARAAVEAMREPTEAMFSDSTVITGRDSEGYGISEGDAKEVWRAGIDGALQPPALTNVGMRDTE